VAPSSWFDKELLAAGAAVLKSAGFNLVYRKDLFEKYRYLAGTDVRRAAELNQYLQDPDVAALFFARGGYGIQRIIDQVDIKALPDIPKLVVGYSDITVLLNYLYNKKNWSTFYGPTIAKHIGAGAPQETMDWLLRAVTHREPLGAVPMRESVVIKPGQATGRVAGGCLTLVHMGIGTPYDVQTDGCILFLEDRGEKLYEIDRMLQHLKHAGKLKKTRGIVFGSMLLHPQDADKEGELIPILKEVLEDFNGPIIANFPAGHLDPFVPVPLGVMSTLSTDPLEWKFTEAACV
jgi:muramoyltetrapeptide carboxypeptidase